LPNQAALNSYLRILYHLNCNYVPTNTSTLSDIPEATLHTSGLRDKYGDVSAEVHQHNQERRVIDIIDKQKISRTHAITWFPQIDPEQDILSKARAEIKAGALIGETIKKHGFKIKKPELAKGVIEIPSWLSQKFDVPEKKAQYSIYQFIAYSNGTATLYGVVCEIYSPDYLPLDKPLKESQTQAINDEDSTPFITALKNYLSSTPNLPTRRGE